MIKSCFRIYKKAKTFYSDNFYLKVAYNCPKDRAFAFVASLKVSKKAVERNKLKRRARAITYPLLKDVPRELARRCFSNRRSWAKKYAEIKNELISLYKKAKII